MVPGFNTDFKYRGETYHVQTEDNGTANPVVVTLLYHKGAILASRRTPYRQLLGTPGFQEELRSLMKTQHKELMRELLAGAFDRDGEIPAAPGGTGEDPAVAAAVVAADAPRPAAAAAPPPAAAAPQPAPPMRTAPPPSPPARPGVPRTGPERVQPAPSRAVRPTAPPPARAAAPPPPATLDEQIMCYLREYAATAAR